MMVVRAPARDSPRAGASISSLARDFAVGEKLA